MPSLDRRSFIASLGLGIFAPKFGRWFREGSGDQYVIANGIWRNDHRYGVGTVDHLAQWEKELQRIWMSARLDWSGFDHLKYPCARS